MSIIKYQTVEVALPNGSAVQIRNQEVTFDSDYQWCTGVCVYRVSASNTLKLGITLGGGHIIQDLTHPADWEGVASVAHKDRFKAVRFRAAGQTHRIVHEPLANLAADERIHVVFRLENE